MGHDALIQGELGAHRPPPGRRVELSRSLFSGNSIFLCDAFTEMCATGSASAPRHRVNRQGAGEAGRNRTGGCRKASGLAVVIQRVFLALCLLNAGCGYRMGRGFEPEIRSVYIPIFKSQADRRGLEFQLTEAVIKEIQMRTPFRIVSEPAADTQLIGSIVNTRKRVLGETRFDDPRELQMTLTVEVRWENLKTGEVLAEKCVPISPNDIQLIQRSEFAPEVGQSLATSYQQLVDRMARDIVDMMEAPTL